MRSKREDSGMAKNIAAWSKRMKELRVENNLSQTDVAKVLHCSRLPTACTSSANDGSRSRTS
mgnify:CR=1 FL=1